MTKRYISHQNGPVDVKTDKDSHTPRTGHTEAAGRQNKAYMPTTEEVRSHYANHRLVTLEGEGNNLPTSYVARRLDQFYGPEFDRWLHKITSAAWEAGSDAGYAFALRHPDQIPVNPYESEEA